MQKNISFLLYSTITTFSSLSCKESLILQIIPLGILLNLFMINLEKEFLRGYKMDFENKYNLIKCCIKEDLDNIEQSLKDLFKEDTKINLELSKLINAPAKRIRPLIGILFLKSIFGKLNKKQLNVLLAVELIHNATLIHDDVIDRADKRRNQDTLNTKFDDNLAVASGDFLLSLAMEKIIETGSIEVLQLCTFALKQTCIGEINQYFDKFKIPSLEDYIKKSKEKTALLFEIAVLCSLLLSYEERTEELKQKAIDFSQNFGIAFQIRDDLINVLRADSNSNNDISSGIYTAPIIFAQEENSKISDGDNILQKLKATKGIEKTKKMMDNYFNKSILALEGLEEGIYKKAILELVELLKVSL